MNAAQEWRTFTSADGARTFKGQLVAFDEETKTVTVLNSESQRITFKMDVISEKDQEYVTESADTLPPDANLSLRFEKLKERKEDGNSSDTKNKTYDGGYTISVDSHTKRLISEAEVEYIIIYRKDSVSGNSSDQTLKGSETVAITPNGSATFDTDTVDLVNYFKPGKAGACSKCPSTRSEQSRDYLIGCVARVSVDGHVVGVSATSPKLLEKYGSELDSGK